MTMQYPPPGGAPSAPPAPSSQGPWWKRGWGIAAIALVALAIGSGIGASANGKSKTKTIAGPTISSTVTATATATVRATVTTTPIVKRVIATRTHVVTHTYTPPPKHGFSDGTYRAGSDINPGQFKTPGGSDCYYQVSTDAAGNNILANNDSSGQMYATVNYGQYLEVSGGCTWRHL